MLLTDFETIKGIIITGIVTYLFFILAIRISGKRSLSQLNAYDFSVTVAFGSILASTLTNSNLSALEGIVSFSLLLFLQYLFAKVTVYVPTFNKFFKASPSLLFYKGKFDEKLMKEKRVTKDDLFQAVRMEQHASMDEVLAIVIEANGQFSVLEYSNTYPQNSTLQNIDHHFLYDDSEND